MSVLTSQTGTVSYVYTYAPDHVYTREYRVFNLPGVHMDYRIEVWSRARNKWISLHSFLGMTTRSIVEYNPQLPPMIEKTRD